MPSTPGLPWLALTRANACLQFSRSQTSSINRSPMAGLSALRFAASDSVPSPAALGASPLSSTGKASTSWFFCRLSLTSRVAYSPLPLTCWRRTVRAFGSCLPTSPSADFCRPVRRNHFHLSLDSETNGRSPEVSSTAFRTQPPNLQPAPLMDMGFAVICQLARRRMPLIRFLYISGHHRTRAATAAGLSELFVLVDVTGLSRSQIAAKQLAHNAIEGQDNCWPRFIARSKTPSQNLK